MSKLEEKKTQVLIMTQYVKDLSFENPNVPEIFEEIKEAPHIELNLDVQVKNVSPDNYEVTLHINTKATYSSKVVFAVELQYAGLFTVTDCENEEQKEQILLIYCPGLIFPFARRIISDVTRDGGFQPLMINPVDFAALYVKHKEDSAKKQ